MRRADTFAVAAGVPGIVLMERAGAAVAKAVRRHWRAGRVVVLAGPGMNGGDGWVAGRLLRDAGFPVTVAYLGDRTALKGDAAAAAARYAGDAKPAAPSSVGAAGLVVDALYGAGVRLPLPAPALALIEAANGGGVPIVAVDLPSGVDGAEGGIGAAAIRATETVTFFRRKPGHLLLPGRTHCGIVTVAAGGGRADDLSQRSRSLARRATAPRHRHPQIPARPRRHRLGTGIDYRSGATGRRCRAANRGGPCDRGVTTRCYPGERLPAHRDNAEGL
jgi:NAD(P)H-hydrate epimerase